jgi:hypothetical protein
MNEIYVFLGPTLTEKEARAELDAVYLPPAAAGDVYRLWRRRPRAIGIVDGYVERVPAVWHKEIMWMMERGVHVFGSAGLGALRAAELDSFGMHGVGWVYQAFRQEALDRDDEVAVRTRTSSRPPRPASSSPPEGRCSIPTGPGRSCSGPAAPRGPTPPSSPRCGGGCRPAGSTSRPPTP